MILPLEISDLIMKYITEFQQLEALVLHFQRIYYPFVNIDLENLDDIIMFIGVMESILPPVNFIRFCGGCNCHRTREGCWTYVDHEPLSVP